MKKATFIPGYRQRPAQVCCILQRYVLLQPSENGNRHQASHLAGTGESTLETNGSAFKQHLNLENTFVIIPQSPSPPGKKGDCLIDC